MFWNVMEIISKILACIVIITLVVLYIKMRMERRRFWKDYAEPLSKEWRHKHRKENRYD